ncbi:hypothetical protein [Mucilaginibacter kameinonensis]|uniref:hypothetical protein n=1 Tax=Mucilaginibacter kameinonensis TaxID=452286 RepID=UPI000EF76411|nr:hypothetical protein [Mucilaginibacter kameinonensis]
MGLVLTDNSKAHFEITLKNWDASTAGEGTLINDAGDTFIIKYPLPLVRPKEDFSSCKIFLLKNRFGSKDDNCFNVEINNQRKGIIFPISIFSNSSILPPIGDSKESDFFYRFLHISYYHLLSADLVINKINEVNNLFDPSSLKIQDFYDDETVVLLYHDTKDQLSVFDLQIYYPQLYKLGYAPIIKETDYSEIEIVSIPLNETLLYSYSLFDSIKLKSIDNGLIEEKYISQLFESTLKAAIPPLSKFILLYQVIELLIDKIAIEYFKNKAPFSSKMSALMINTMSATSFRSVMDNVTLINKDINAAIDIKKEDTRINKLFNEKCKLEISDFPKLESLSKTLLPEKNCETLTEHVYALRNKIVHDYHNLSGQFADIDDLLRNLNIEFEKLIFEVIVKYENC